MVKTGIRPSQMRKSRRKRIPNIQSDVADIASDGDGLEEEQAPSQQIDCVDESGKAKPYFSEEYSEDESEYERVRSIETTGVLLKEEYRSFLNKYPDKMSRETALYSEAGHILRRKIFFLSILTAQDVCRYQVRILAPIIKEVMRNSVAAAMRLMEIDHRVGGGMQSL